MKKIFSGFVVISFIVFLGSILAHGRPINTIGPENEGPSGSVLGESNNQPKQNLPEPPNQPGQSPAVPRAENQTEQQPLQPSSPPQSRPVNQPPPPITQ